MNRGKKATVVNQCHDTHPRFKSASRYKRYGMGN